MPLPEGWHWHNDARTLKRRVEGHPGWWIEVDFDSHAPWDGPTGLHIETDFSTDESLSAVADTSGLTTAVLRGIPLGDIRREYKEILRALRAPADEQQRPERVETDTDLAFVARYYADLVDQGHRSPIVELSEIYAVGRKTMSARIQRARARGLLEGERHKPATKLTDTAKALIAEALAKHEQGGGEQ
jgi:hypothetical protein